MRIREDLKRPDTINTFADFLDSGIGVSCGYFGCCDHQSTNSGLIDICFELSQLPRTTVQKVKLLAGFVPEKCLEGCPRQDPCMEFGLNNPQISDFMQNYGDFSRVLLQDFE